MRKMTWSVLHKKHTSILFISISAKHKQSYVHQIILGERQDWKKNSPKSGWFWLGLTPLYMSEKGSGFQTTVKYKLEPGAEGLQIAEPHLQQLGLNFNIPFIKYMTITDNQMIDAQFLTLLYCSHIICWLIFGHILKYIAYYYKNCNKIKIYCISEGRRNTENCFLI